MASNIVNYLHCRKCVQNLPIGVTPQDYQSVEVGIDADGNLVIWCKRHDILVSMFEPKHPLVASCEKCEA